MAAIASATYSNPPWSVDSTAWAECQEPLGKHLWIDMLKSGRVLWRSRVLDLGCGSGGAAAMARGLGAEVTGLDSCAEMIEIARKRVCFGRFIQADMHDIPCDDASFDLVFAADAVGYADNPSQAWREMRRVCAPRGRVSVATWGDPEECDQAKLFRDIQASRPHPLTQSTPLDLEAQAEKAGLRVVGNHESEVWYDYPSLEVGWRAQRSLLNVDASQEANVKASLQKFQNDRGAIRMRNVFRFVVAVPV